eukprot:jgi/Hompol1/6386/HPOL_000770-RA
MDRLDDIRVDAINGSIDGLHRDIDIIRRLHSRALVATGHDELSLLNRDLDQMRSNTRQQFTAIRDRLTTMSAQTKQLRGADAKARSSHQAILAKRLLETGEMLQQAEFAYKEASRARMAREIRIARPDATDIEIEMALDSQSGPIFAQRLLSSRVREQQAALQAVQGRQAEMLRLEQSIEDLAQLFQDLAILLEQQQEIIDVIEVHGQKVEEDLVSGGVQIDKAIIQREKDRRFWQWTAVIAGIVAVIVVAILWELVQHAVDHQIGGPVSNSAMELAAINGNIDTMDWMHQRGIGGCTSNAMDHAASHGDLRIVTWLHETCGESGTFNAVDRAACSGHLEVIKYLHSKCGLVCTLEGLLSSARFGHFETFKYICVNQDLDRIQNETNDAIEDARSRLKRIAAQTKNMRGPEVKARQGQQSTLAKRLMEAAQVYQNIQVSYKNKYRTRMAREIRIARPDATNAEIEQALDSQSGPVFAQQMLSSRVREQQSALQAVQGRHAELRKMEESIEELAELFQDMQVLLEAQQEMIDTIETHVENADEYVRSGGTQLKKAIVSRERSRRFWQRVSIAIVILLAIVALILYFYRCQVFSVQCPAPPKS